MSQRPLIGPAIMIAIVGLFALESWLFLEIGKRFGLLPVLAWVFVSFLLGALLIRVEGVRMLFRMHVQLQRGVVPAQEMLSAMAIVLGGLLLMLPGYFTDAVGLLLLFPPTRALFWFLCGRSLARWVGLHEEAPPMRRASDEVIEVKAQRIEDSTPSA